MILAIDPGIAGTGFALFPEKGAGFTPVEVGVIDPEEEGWIRAHEICDELNKKFGRKFLAKGKSLFIFCELPSFMPESLKGETCAKSGSLVKLVYSVGALGQWASSQGYRFELVPVQTWKGQLPKSVVERRIRKILGEQACTRLGIRSHAWDAVGIGLHKKGKF